VSKKLTTNLLSLVEADKQVFALSDEKKQILSSQEKLSGEIAEHTEALSECQTLLELRKAQREEESQRLKSEEVRLSEQRRQLTALGSKSAKLVERQIDIASQTLQQMAERTTKLVEEVEELEAQAASLKDTVDNLESQLKDEADESTKRLSEIEGEVASFEKTRKTVLDKLDDRLKRLYTRVHTRYPGSSISIAQKHSCRSCYRALPSQMYNQIMAGNMLIQCPGCSRILVYVAEDVSQKVA